MKDIFISSTLKSEWNKRFNIEICKKLEEALVVCYLPQRDTSQGSSEMEIYKQNIDGIKKARKVLAVWLNESINWWLEIGYSFGSWKDVILLTQKNHQIPVMSYGMFSNILEVENLDNIDDYLKELIQFIKE